MMLVAGILVFKLIVSVGLMLNPDTGLAVESAASLAGSPGEALAADPPAAGNGNQAATTAAGAETAETAGAASEPVPTDPDLELRNIQREREELELLRTEVNGKIAELEAIQSQILTLIEQLEGVYTKKEKHLVKILSGMPPKKAAPMINKLDMDLVVKIFAGMKSDIVGKIIPYLEPERAAEVGQRLASRQ